MSRTNKLFMAVAAGRKSVEGGEIKRYIGVAPVFILGVNPNKEELEKLYGTEFDSAPNYIGEGEVGPDKKKVAQIRIDFIVKTDGEKCRDAQGNPVELLSRVSFFVRNTSRTNNAGNKVQVIDKYGRTGWVTKEEFEKKALPSYMTDPFRLDKDYRAAYWGEEELVKFIKAYLVIPDVEQWKDRKIVGLKPNPAESEIFFEHISDWFKGDVKELRDAVALQPENEVRVLFGIRTTEENRQYQAVYTQRFIPMSAKKENAYAALDKEVQERKNAGAYPSTEFEVCDLKEYVVKPTDLAAVETGDMPDFSGQPGNPWG